MMVFIRGAGDLASGIALRLWRCGFQVVMTDLEQPTAIRRTVAFSECLLTGQVTVEGVTAQKATDAAHAKDLLTHGILPVLADPDAICRQELAPMVVVDAILAKKNRGTTMDDALAVIAVGPGFTAGVDCHGVVESMRGHTLGRVYYQGSALPNTGMPGLIGGFSGERVLRAPTDGSFTPLCAIGDQVEEGDVVATVEGQPMYATLTGTLRGILPQGTPVHKGMKAGDIDPRCQRSHCYTASDKALAIAGGVLEAILVLTRPK